MDNLPVQSLQYKDIKQSLTNFIKNNPDYKDWNFQSSGINTLLNLLSYNTHYIGYYVKMLMDEAFVDSAHTREALLSTAKRTGYIPKNKQSARAVVNLTINQTQPSSDIVPSSLTFKANEAHFTGSNVQTDSRVFSLNEDMIIYSPSEPVAIDGGEVSIAWTSGPLTIYEGTYESFRFIVDSNNLNQRFVIRDPNIDITTIKIDVELDEQVEQFTLATDIFALTPESKVFFITTEENGFYQIFFGDDVFGLKPQGGSVIHCNYISTNGPSGNGAKSFVFNYLNQDIDIDSEVETLSVSSGGLEPETQDSLRFTIPHHWRRQNRIHTESDYRSVLLSEFRNIDSINVWGGEKNEQKSYGKVFVSIKPKYADQLTSASKEEIRQKIVSRYGSVGTDVQFVEPEFIETDLVIRGKVDPRLTNEPIKNTEAALIALTRDYDTAKLNKFESMFSDVDLLSTLRSSNPALSTLYSTKILRKKIKILHGSSSTNSVPFSNEINQGVSSNLMVFNNKQCRLQDRSGLIYLVDLQGSDVLPNSSGNVDYKTGRISFSVPKSLRVVGYEANQFGTIQFTVSPKLPDIYTVLNNIIRISTIRVHLTN